LALKLFWQKNIGGKAACVMSMKLTTGVNFTIISRAALEPVKVRYSFWNIA